MILTAFDVKFHEKKNELPPRACRRPKKFQKFKHNVFGNGPPARLPARAGRPGGAAPREEEKGGSGGQRPPGNILVFRMFHILVGATA